MSQTPNYDRLPIDLRIAQEERFDNFTSSIPETASPEAKEQYVAALRQRNDQRMPEGQSLNGTRENLAAMADWVSTDFLQKLLERGQEPATGRSAKAIAEQGPGRARTGMGIAE